jgi:hypothetical protein
LKKRGNPKSDWKPENQVAYDPSPVCVKVLPGVREQLKAVDDWQNKIRKCIDKLIEEEGGG